MYTLEVGGQGDSLTPDEINVLIWGWGGGSLHPAPPCPPFFLTCFCVVCLGPSFNSWVPSAALASDEEGGPGKLGNMVERNQGRPE